MKRFTGIIILTLVLFTGFTTTGCAYLRNKTSTGGRIAIAEQFGLAYAPLQIMRELKLIEKNLPEAEIAWKQLGNTAVIREAMLAGEINVGFMAIPPFLIGWDKGMPWKIACGLSTSPVGLVANTGRIKSLKDFSKEDRIAVPQPGSVQHILLSMACEKEFGDSHRLDNLLVTLAHPEGMAALLSGRNVTAHFTTPPYLLKELEVDGMHQVLTGRDAAGTDFTFIIGVATEEFHNKFPGLYAGFLKSVEEAVEFIGRSPDKAAQMLADAYNMPETELKEYFTREDAGYGLEISGVDEFAGFMKRNGYISRLPEKSTDVVWRE